MSGAYYNENDEFAAATLRNLIDAGLIAPGVVDTRSIVDVRPEDLRGFSQCHFFAGIGVWSYALRCAGWPDDQPVWTGSCPCQPFSTAGKGGGFDDERHLWPAWHHLIRECHPAAVFGEQVASKDAEPWVDLVQDDMEALDYAFGAVPFPAASVGAPHIRDRLYWVAHASSPRLEGRDQGALGHKRPAAKRSRSVGGFGTLGATLAELAAAPSSGWMVHANGELADDDGTGLSRFAGLRLRGSAFHDADGRGPVRGFWADAEWIPCRDGKWRPVEPGTFPLAHGAPARVGRLRGYGNAICAPAAQVFIEEVMGAFDE